MSASWVVESVRCEDLRPGDVIWHDGRWATVTRVEWERPRYAAPWLRVMAGGRILTDRAVLRRKD